MTKTKPQPPQRKWLSRSLFATVLLVFCLGWLLVTPLGFRLTLHIVKRLLPVELKVTHAHGRWIGPIDIKNMTLSLNGMDITFKHAYFNWQPNTLLKGRLKINQLAIKDVDITATPSTAPTEEGAPSNAEASSEPFELPMAIEVQQSDIRNIHISGFTRSTIKVSRISLHVVADDTGVNGQFGFDSEFPAIHGSAKLSGNHHNYNMAAHVQSEKFDIKAEGDSDDAGTRVTSNKGKLLGGEVAIKADMHWDPTQKWHVEILANNIKDILSSGTTHSEINLHLIAKGEPENDLITVDIPKLDGTWRSSPLNAKLQLTKKADTLNTHGNINVADAKISFKAKLGEQLNAQWRANIPKLYALIPDAKGRLTMTGKISGSKDKPRADITLDGQHIATKFLSTEALRGKLHFDANHRQQSKGELKLIDMAYKRFLIDSTTLSFLGGTSEDSYKLHIQKDHQSLALDLQGMLDEDGWQGALTHLAIEAPELSWALDAKTPIVLGAKAVKIDPICITPDQGKLCLNSSWSREDGWSVGINADGISGKALVVLLPTEDNLQHVKGSLNADMTLSGKNSTLTAADGNIHLKDLSLFVKPASTTFKDGDIKLQGHGDKLTLRAQIASQNGPLDINGHITIGKPVTSQLLITGDNFLARDSHFLRLAITPNISLKGLNEDITFSGTLNINSAEVQKQRFSHVASLPDELTYRHLMANMEPPFIKLHGAIDVDLGDKAKVSLSGLIGKIVGKLKVMRSIEGNMTATGQLSLKDAHYIAHGQKITISKGDLNFLGDSIANPRLEVVAERTFDLTNQVGEINTDLTADMLTVGLKVSGTASNNTIKLFSHPLKLSDMAILSYLITGQPGSSNPTGNFGTLALLTLNSFSSSSSLADTVDKTEKLQDSTLLDEFAITQEESLANAAGESTGTMVTLGKRVTPNLFLKYRFGLASEDYTLSATYQLSRHYAMQLYSKMLGTGLNLIYRN